jgi:alanyl-tRNA synthetase
VKIIGCDRIRARALMKFLSGGQALQDYRLRFGVTANLSRSLTCGVADLPARVNQLTADLGETRHRLSEAYHRLLPSLVEDLIARQSPESTDIVAGVANLPDQHLQSQLATMVAERAGRPAMIIDGQRLLIACSVGGPDLSGLTKEFARLTGLRGGGSRTMVQFGSAQPDRLDEYRRTLRELLAL